MVRKIGEGFTPQQIGGILTSIKKGNKSYTYFARKYKTSANRISRLCKKHGVRSKFEEPYQLKKSRNKSLGRKILDFFQ